MKTLQYRRFHGFFFVCQVAAMLGRFVSDTCTYFQQYGGLLNALHFSAEPRNTVERLWDILLWAIQWEVWHLLHITPRTNPNEGRDNPIPPRPVLATHTTIMILQEHLNQAWRWIEELERLVVSHSHGLEFFNVHMENMRISYLGAAYGHVPNVPTAIPLFGPPLCPENSHSDLEPPSADYGDEAASDFFIADV
ncbi:uncharacterized protein LOC120252901 [Dioscorea cayenensis subsp. rotundata]|uniref:Uncharacterized protein LOC120252901 n=1 Tax=Dioscorea cayennensis subsp. rotundata TaxID=55577 RepID=A0AB40AQ30_DIOCR|nr:uncharacterized protein LOC120252901 [Dioscorea cayenensis subsp. rotundata]